jgi:hypothetical protein
MTATPRLWAVARQSTVGIVSDLDRTADGFSRRAPWRAAQLMAERAVVHVAARRSGYPVGILPTFDVAAVYARG